MKKLIYCALALAAGLFASSCQQENLEPVAGENYTVTYAVEAPAEVQTKAIADGLNVDELIYEVWWTSADETTELKDAQLLYQARTEMVNLRREDGTTVNRGTVTLNLVKDQHYTILFWAQKKGTGVYNTESLLKVHYNSENLTEAYFANDDALAAFYAVDFVNDGIAKNSTVTLKRPFAQVNLATLNERDPKNNPADYNITLVNSKMKLNKVPTQFNVATSAVDGDAVVEFKYNSVPSTEVAYTTEARNEYYYAGMNYVFAGSNLELTYQIQTRLNGSEALAEITNTIPNVPVKENYRTNIVGNLLTSQTDYEVIVAAGFNTNNNSGNVEVVGEGIVKNMNGDYEVSTARGFAYALTYLMSAEKQGTDPLEVRNFYLHDNFNMENAPFVSPTIPEGVQVNIYGQVPVVTRSSSVTFGSVVITGLTQPLIAKVEAGASLTVAGVEIPVDENTTSVLIDFIDEEATVVVSEVVVETIANDGDKHVVSATKVKNLDELQAALKSGVNEITGNVTITQEPGVEVVIDGRGKTLNGVITVDGKSGTYTTAALTIKDLTFAAEAISADACIRLGDGNNATRYTCNVTVENCTFDVPGAVGVKSYTGGDKNLIIKNCTATANAHSLLQAAGIDGIHIEGCTVNSKNGMNFNQSNNVTISKCDANVKGYAVRFGASSGSMGTDEVYTIENSTLKSACEEDGDAVIVLRPTADKATLNITNTTLEGKLLFKNEAEGSKVIIDGVARVSTADELVAALEAKENVFFANDIKVEPASMSNAYGKTGILVYNGQTIDGAGHKIDVKGAGGTWDSGICTSGGTIKNLWVTGSFRGIFVKGADHVEKVVLDNVRVEGTTYTISIDQASKQGLEATNSIFRGWTSYAATIGDVKFTNCTFGAGNGYNFSRPYAPTEYVNCEFEAGHQIDPVGTVTFQNCTINGEPLTAANIGTLVISDKGKYSNATLITADGEVKFASTTADLQAALAEGKKVVLANDLTITPEEMTTAPYGNKMALSQNGGVFNGNGKNISVTANGDNYVVMTNGGTIKNLDIDRGFRGIVLMSPKQDVYVDNVNIGVDDEVCYTINTAEGEGANSLHVSNSNLYGWCSIGTAVKDVTFTNCTFGQGTYYTDVYGRLVKPYVDAIFDSCDFCDKCYIDLSAFVGKKVTVKNCTVNGVKITAENWTSLVAPESTCSEGQISVELKNGTYLTAENVADYIVFE